MGGRCRDAKRLWGSPAAGNAGDGAAPTRAGHLSHPTQASAPATARSLGVSQAKRGEPTADSFSGLLARKTCQCW